MSQPPSDRARIQDPAVQQFLAQHGWSEAIASPLSETGASLRQYLRLSKANGQTAILVFADNADVEITRFTDISNFLRGMQLSAPKIYASDVAAKLMLQEDFGHTSYANLIANGADPLPLHLQATDVLLAVQTRFDANHPLVSQLSPYSFTRWKNELQNFYLHYLPCVGAPLLTEAEQEQYWAIWQRLLAPFESLPPTLLLRDFKPANLMHIEGRTGLAATGLIDFQDAGLGAPFYDLVELCQSWRRVIPPAQTEAVIARYTAGRPEFNRTQIESGIMAFGAIRWIGWLSNCARYSRQGRPQFLPNIPGIWRAADECLANPALAELREFFDRYAPRDLRAPQKGAA